MQVVAREDYILCITVRTYKSSLKIHNKILWCCKLLLYLGTVICTDGFSQATRYCHDSWFNRRIFTLFKSPERSYEMMIVTIFYWPVTKAKAHNSNRYTEVSMETLPSLSNKKCFHTFQPNGSKSSLEYLNPPSLQHWSSICYLNEDIINQCHHRHRRKKLY